MVAGLFMRLVLAFGRARDAVLIMLNLPSALIGGGGGVLLSGVVVVPAMFLRYGKARWRVTAPLPLAAERRRILCKARGRT